MESALRAVSAGWQGIAEKPSPHLKQKAVIKKIRLADRKILHPELAGLFSEPILASKSLRNRVMRVAHFANGDRQKEIADHLGPHYATVSNILRSSY